MRNDEKVYYLVIVLIDEVICVNSWLWFVFEGIIDVSGFNLM